MLELFSRGMGSGRERKVKQRESQFVIICHALKLTSTSDGKSYLTDCANTQDMLRIIQSIPSSNAEPFKLWLAEVGYERLQENKNPSLIIERAMKIYLKKGYTIDEISKYYYCPIEEKEATMYCGTNYISPEGGLFGNSIIDPNRLPSVLSPFPALVALTNASTIDTRITKMVNYINDNADIYAIG
ncbi:hypothetical protein LCGC14_2783140, partial [marine sediment metagenome]